MTIETSSPRSRRTSRPSVRSKNFVAGVVAAILLLSLGGNTLAISPGPVTSTLKESFEVGVSDPAEQLLVRGTIHVVTQATTTDGNTDIHVHANLSDTTGRGLETGTRSRIIGAQSWDLQGPPEGGVWEVLLAYQKLVNEEGKQDRELGRLRLTLHFDESMKLIAMEVGAPPPCDGCGP